MFGIKCTFFGWGEPLKQLCDSWFFAHKEAVEHISSILIVWNIIFKWNPGTPLQSSCVMAVWTWQLFERKSLNVERRKIKPPLKHAFIHDNTPRAWNTQNNRSRWVCGLWSLDDHLFLCCESTAAWWGYVTYPRVYSLCQVGIKVINASFDRCWKVSLKHERTSMASIIMLPSLPAHVSTLHGFIFTIGVHDILV